MEKTVYFFHNTEGNVPERRIIRELLKLGGKYYDNDKVAPKENGMYYYIDVDGYNEIMLSSYIPNFYNIYKLVQIFYDKENDNFYKVEIIH